MNDLEQDIRYALRSLRRAPLFAVIAIATLALGIGANTAIFSVVDAIVVRPLPYPRPEQLVGMRQMTLAEVTRLRELNRSFAEIAATLATSVGISGERDAERVDAAAVTSNLFATLGVAPTLGRWFTHDEAAPGHSHVVMLSYALWLQRFAGDRNAIGQTLTIDGSPYTVIGVMPSDFHFPSADAQLWTPMEIPANRGSGAFWGVGGLGVIGRLRTTVAAAQAHHELKTLFEQIRLENPIWRPGRDYTSDANTNVAPLQSKVVGSARTMLLLLLGVVSVVLLIACANVANLLLVRASAREREMAIRAAIGGSRARLIRQALTESVVLAAMGGVSGLALAWIATHAIAAILPADTPRVAEIALNMRVLSFTGALALLTGVVFGIAPALRGSNIAQSALAAGGRGGGGRSHRRLASALVSAEIAAAVALVAAALLLVRSVDALRRIDPGFTVDAIVTARVSPPAQHYNSSITTQRFYGQVLDRVRAIPGVVSAAVVDKVPLTVGYGGALRIAGQFEDISGASGYLPTTDHSQVVSPSYFATMGMPLVAGRPFDATDRGDARQVAIVSQSFARRFWPATSAVGQRIGYPWPSDWITIVGVVRDAKLDSLTGTNEQAMYVPLAQRPPQAAAHPEMSLVIRSHEAAAPIPQSLALSLRTAVSSIDNTVPVSGVRTMSDVAAGTQARPRFTMLLLTLFAGIALLLGVVGIYGLMSYAVAQRQREVGIRMALGASPANAQTMILGEGMKLASIGIAVGLIAALSTTRLLSGFLYGVTATDPLAFIAATLLLAIVALLASYVPARRATRVDPTTALRSE